MCVCIYISICRFHPGSFNVWEVRLEFKSTSSNERSWLEYSQIPGLEFKYIPQRFSLTSQYVKITYTWMSLGRPCTLCLSVSSILPCHYWSRHLSALSLRTFELQCLTCWCLSTPKPNPA